MNIKCQDLCFAYSNKNVIENICLEIQSGQLISIAGPNGIGKSTLIKCLCNIYKSGSGSIYLNGKEIAEMNAKELAKSMGYVPQKQVASFTMTVYEMTLLGRRPYIKWKVTANDEAVVESVLQRLNIMHLAERELNTLSGGEKQKVAIARSLAQEPEILFLDEPTSSLDINHQLEVMEILSELVDVDRSTVVTVLHDLNLVNNFSDVVYLLENKGIYAAGKPELVLTENNIKEVYGIDVDIVRGENGSYIVPVRFNSRKNKLNQNKQPNPNKEVS
ncbi:MAG: ABC transporter ATP-binding protein [Halanaerobiaceae bacterium]